MAVTVSLCHNFKNDISPTPFFKEWHPITFVVFSLLEESHWSHHNGYKAWMWVAGAVVGSHLRGCLSHSEPGKSNLLLQEYKSNLLLLLLFPGFVFKYPNILCCFSWICFLEYVYAVALSETLLSLDGLDNLYEHFKFSFRYEILYKTFLKLLLSVFCSICGPLLLRALYYLY